MKPQGLSRALWVLCVFVLAGGFSEGDTAPRQVKKIGTGSVLPYEVDFYPGAFGEAGGSVYFAGTDGAGGRELWKTDGTAGGTHRVRDIYPGANTAASNLWSPRHNSNPSNPINMGGTLFFFADDGSHGMELWKSDGTESGTRLVKDIHPGGKESVGPSSMLYPWGSVSYLRWDAAVLGGALYFKANDGVGGTELWRTDGSDEGTTCVLDLVPGIVGSNPSYLTAMGGYLYFSAANAASSNDHELWRSDGTAAGTTRVADIRSGTSGSYPRDLTVAGGTLFFTADDGSTGRELWASDGSEGGTHRVADILTGSGASNPQLLTAVGTTLYFIADDGSTGFELWRSDGATAEQAADIRAGSSSSEPDQLTNLNGVLIFAANDGTTGLELWRCDETGASRLLDVRSGSASSLVHAEGNCTRFFAALEDRVFFSARSVSRGELWATDGTSTGTVRLAETSLTSLNLRNIAACGGRVWFGSPEDLWVSDGTTTGTTQVAKSPDLPGSYPRYLINHQEMLYFAADDATSGAELWRSDGTLSGTTLVKDIYVDGAVGSNPSGLTPFDSVFLFGFSDTWEDGIWKSDGTAGGTVEIKSNVGASGPFVVAGNQAFCADGNDQQLWVTDGTADGTMLLHDHGSSALIRKMTAFGGKLYYTADDDAIWASDGTVSGTVAVVDTWPFGGLNTTLAPAEWTTMGSALYLCAMGASGGYELWKTDGTNGGTSMVMDIYTGNGSSTPDNLLEMNGALYFSARPGTWVGTGRELWRSDGAESGTAMLKDIIPGVGESIPQDFVKVGNMFYFTASTPSAGRELWRCNGTEGGTAMVKDANPGADGSCPHMLTALEPLNMLAFAAFTPDRGVELWVSDGTEAGTRRVSDIYAGAAYSNPSDLRLVGKDLFFRATSPQGTELWALDTTDLKPRATANWTVY